MIEAPDLVRLAMQRSGSAGPTELARALGLTSYEAPKSVRRWLSGQNEPSYEVTLALLELAGALNLDALRKEAVLERAEELKGRVRDARSGAAQRKAADA